MSHHKSRLRVHREQRTGPLLIIEWESREQRVRSALISSWGVKTNPFFRSREANSTLARAVNRVGLVSAIAGFSGMPVWTTL